MNTKLLTQSEVAAILERAAKATPGPWTPRCDSQDDLYWLCNDKDYATIKDAAGGFVADFEVERTEEESKSYTTRPAARQRVADNIFFIASSRTDVPALCDTIDALRARLEVATAELQGIVEYWNGAPESAVDAIETVVFRAHNCLAHLNTLAAEALGTQGENR